MNPITEIAQRVYNNGYLKQNQFIVHLSSPVGMISDIPVFSVTLPGFDINTIEQRDVTGPIKYIPERKTYIQGLFINFFMSKNLRGSPYELVNAWSEYFATGHGTNRFYEDGAGFSRVAVDIGQDPSQPDMTVVFYEAYPRVLYPIDLKPVEEIVPFTFSANFGYRRFEIFIDGASVEGGGGAYSSGYGGGFPSGVGSMNTSSTMRSTSALGGNSSSILAMPGNMGYA